MIGYMMVCQREDKETEALCSIETEIYGRLYIQSIKDPIESSDGGETMQIASQSKHRRRHRPSKAIGIVVSVC